MDLEGKTYELVLQLALLAQQLASQSCDLEATRRDALQALDLALAIHSNLRED